MSTTKIIRANHGKAATAALTEAVTAFKNGDPLTAVTVVVTVAGITHSVTVGVELFGVHDVRAVV